MGWVLEVFKMSLYVSFPVGLFHYFNSPGNIEDDLQNTRKELIEKYIGIKRFEEREQFFRERKERQLQERDRKNADL